MSKFEVGDRVVGNKKASERYNITSEGWRGTVVRILDGVEMKVKGSGGLFDIGYTVRQDCFDLAEPRQKIVVTTDGKTTTARLFSGKDLVKSAEAKCSPGDEFVFETGAALALDRLLDRKKADPESPKFTKADLKTGLFGRMSNGCWFVVLGEKLLYGEPTDSGIRGGYDLIEMLDDSPIFRSGNRIDFVLEACSFCNARDRARRGSFLWSRPGAKFE